MWLRINNADFDAMHLSLEVSPNDVVSFGTKFERFIVLCKSEGFRRIAVGYGDDISPAHLRELEECAERRFLDLHGPGVNPPAAPVTSKGRLTCDAESAESPAEPGCIQYQLVISGFDLATDWVLSAIHLICSSLGIEDVPAGNLRLCAYELVANCIEHGVFEVPTPTVVLSMKFQESEVEVTYLDNGTPFVSSRPLVDLVEEQAQSGSRRGLGLFIIHRLGCDVDSTRTDDWNVTSFTISFLNKSFAR
jgi:anti-sigma regulatory factor (Ser/Thr protein kinase)